LRAKGGRNAAALVSSNYLPANENRRSENARPCAGYATGAAEALGKKHTSVGFIVEGRPSGTKLFESEGERKILFLQRRGQIHFEILMTANLSENKKL